MYTCPRCLGSIPNEAYKGQYPGALSRTDNSTEICSDCGSEEALSELISQDQWPVRFHPMSI
jgi:hypothetical protein